MATRTLFALVALALPACSSSQDRTSSSVTFDMSKSRLVGAWEMPPPSADELVSGSFDLSWIEECKRDGGWPFERFDADGTYHVDGFLYEGVPTHSTWRIVNEGSNCVTIEVAGLPNGNATHRTITFENDDRIRMDSNLVLLRRKVDLHALQLAEDAQRYADDRIRYALDRACQSTPGFSHINQDSAVEVLIRYERRWTTMRTDARSVDAIRAELDPLRTERHDSLAAVTGPTEADALLAVLQPDLGF